MLLKEFIEKNGVNDKLLAYCISAGLRNLNDDEDMEEEEKEELMQRFSIESDEKIETMINEIDELSWKV